MKLISSLVLLTLVSCGKHSKTVYVQGVQGPAGGAGQSCHAESVTGGVNVICGNGVSFVANGQNGNAGQDGKDGVNGQDGRDGVDGQDGTFTGSLAFVQICPNVRPQSYMETMIELDGEYLAYLAANNWKDQRLVKLIPGQVYQTTDGRDVQFKITNGQIVCL